jgi:hypothetical protein
MSPDESLADGLDYLRPALSELSALRAEELNEDVDLSGIEAALRERIKGLTIREAIERLKGDLVALKKWRKQSGNSDAAISFVIGVLSYRPGHLARRLLAPVQIAEPQPIIIFEPPDGWSTEPISPTLQIRVGRKKIGAIMVIGESTVELLVHQNEIRDDRESRVRSRNPFAVPGEWTKFPVRFGNTHGNKYLYTQVKPAPWKSVQYLLKVPGGAVDISLNANGKEFDESLFESKLHTLRVEPASRVT